MSVAFELREEHKQGGDKPFAGGSVALPRGESFDIGEALEEGGGVIVTDNLTLIDRLTGVPALERVAAELVPEEQETEEPAESPDESDDAGWLGENREEA